MTIKDSEDMLLENIIVSSRSTNGNPSRNTDGADTIASNRITFRGGEIDNGDDSIALKANSTNILMENVVLWEGSGIAMGWIGQHLGIYEYILRTLLHETSPISAFVTLYQNLDWHTTKLAAKRRGRWHWRCSVERLPPLDVYQQPIQVTQCTSFSGITGGCDASTFKTSDVTWGPMTGNITYNTLARLQCSAASLCENVRFDRMDSVKVNGTDSSQTRGSWSRFRDVLRQSPGYIRTWGLYSHPAVPTIAYGTDNWLIASCHPQVRCRVGKGMNSTDDAVAALRELETAAIHGFASKSSLVTGVCILFYDHMLTFSDEVRYVWKQKWSIVSTIFVLNRYVTPFAIAVDLYDKVDLQATSHTLSASLGTIWKRSGS
ncbi:polygalacturonase [Ceratobasidium sp. AG-Ba]|nr:polygalacturonase [Ceratobasidium sp. AG-Ba]